MTCGGCAASVKRILESQVSLFLFFFFFKFFYQVINLNEMKDFETRFLL